MVSATSASRYITSASRYHPRYQSRSSMNFRGLSPRNIAELAEAVPIVDSDQHDSCYISEKKTKIVLALRNPKDVAVSFYHHHKGMESHKYDGKFADYFQLFIEGKCKNILV